MTLSGVGRLVDQPFDLALRLRGQIFDLGGGLKCLGHGRAQRAKQALTEADLAVLDALDHFGRRAEARGDDDGQILVEETIAETVG